MRLFAPRGGNIPIFAILIVMLAGISVYVSAQDTEKPGVAVYVMGVLPDNEKSVLGAYLLNSIVNSGNGTGDKNAGAFLAAAKSEEDTAQGGNLSKKRVCELGRQFNIRYICAASVTSAFDFFVITARMVDTETEEITHKSEIQSPLKTIEDLTQASGKLTESMFGASVPDAQTKPETESESEAPQSQSAESEPAAEAPTAAAPVTGEAAAAAEKVIAAVNAFKDATNKSIAAVNAVKTATQAKNFSAIMDAKKKVESAAEAVKKAKADVTAAIDAMKSAGPDAAEAVKATGVDISMFEGPQAADGGEGGEARGGVDWYVTPKYLMVPLGLANTHGADVEFGVVWGKGLFIGVDIGATWGVGVNVAGFSLNTGNTYDITPDLQVTYGTFGGYWSYNLSFDERTIGGGVTKSHISYPLGYLGPFVRFRFWRRAEIAYRGFISGGGYENQVMSGFYFATSNRNKPPKERTVDWYIAPKYQTPVGTPVSWGGVNLEGGAVWGGGAFFGVDVGYGGGGGDSDNSGVTAGIGLSLGNVYDLGNDLQLVYGVSAGFWLSERQTAAYISDYKYDLKEKTFSFLGPFVKLRYSCIEASYRGLLGIKETDYEEYTEKYYPDYGYTRRYIEPREDNSFAYAHQLMLGFYFATSKRVR